MFRRVDRMPKVSVIVPVYNVEKYIGRCLNSLLKQTEKDIEIIVVNDGSEDNSQLIIDEYVVNNPGKIISLTKENGGLSDARNFGIPYARGEYISFVDSDDYVEKNMYEELLKKSESGKKKIITCGYFMDWESKSIVKIDNNYKDVESYILSGLVIAWNKLYRRDWLLETQLRFPKGLLYEDLQFFCELLLSVESMDEVSIVKKPLIHYIQRDNSISYSNSSKIDDIQIISKNVIDYYKAKQVNHQYIQAVECKFVKTLLGNFMLKYMRISDKKIKRASLKKNWDFLNSMFPDWKSNIYLIENCSFLKRLYYKNMNHFTYLIVTSTPIKLLEFFILR